MTRVYRSPLRLTLRVIWRPVVGKGQASLRVSTNWVDTRREEGEVDGIGASALGPRREAVAPGGGACSWRVGFGGGAPAPGECKPAVHRTVPVRQELETGRFVWPPIVRGPLLLIQPATQSIASAPARSLCRVVSWFLKVDHRRKPLPHRQQLWVTIASGVDQILAAGSR